MQQQTSPDIEKAALEWSSKHAKWARYKQEFMLASVRHVTSVDSQFQRPIWPDINKPAKEGGKCTEVQNALEEEEVKNRMTVFSAAEGHV